jgi:hypothetical protein
LFEEGIILRLGSLNLVILGVAMTGAALVFLAMNKISGSRWVAGTAACLFITVVNLMDAWVPIA